MIRFETARLMAMSANLAWLDAWVKGAKPTGIDQKLRQQTLGHLDSWEEACKDIGLGMALPHIGKIRQLLSRSDATVAELALLCKELAQRIIDQSAGRTYLALTYQESRFYLEQAPFGAVVIERFSAAGTDIAEASRCLGLGRHTAGAFHCMRAVETGLKAVAKNLGLTAIRDDSWSWGSVLAQVNTAIQKNKAKKPKPAKWKEREPFLTDVSVHLQTIKTAWRNPTMHTVKTYSPEEAIEVFSATRGFMRHLAERLNEDGVWLSKPKPTHGSSIPVGPSESSSRTALSPPVGQP
jgi:hypothetical protein